ncbi:MAG: MurR/RpiR family transcriptional regulator [Pseudomonadota bacterium]
MTQDAEGRTIAERLRDGFSDLTRAERQLANTLLEGYPVAGLGSITAVASRADVSTPTVLRMARKLGFDGFPEMQAALHAELGAMVSDPLAKRPASGSASPAGMRHAEASEDHILNRFAGAVMQNVEASLRHLDVAAFEAIAGRLADPKAQIYIVGGRITHALADYLFTQLQVMRDGVRLLPPGANTWPHDVLGMRPGDTLLIFDIRRYERSLLGLAEMARAQGASVVVITDQWGSPLTASAAHAVHARIEVPSAWDSTIVLSLIVEALLAAVQEADWEGTAARMTRLEGLFDATGLFRKFT